MQPQQPYTPAPASPPQPGQSNYDFILNPAKPPRKSLFSFNGNSMTQRLIIALGGIFVLVVIVAIIANSLNSTTDYLPSMLSVLQEQQEIVHTVTTLSQNVQTKLNTTNSNLAVTLQLTVASSQSDLISYLQKNGHKVSPNQLNLKINTATDQQLSTAAQAGTYDATFDSVIQSELQAYQQYLKAAYIKDTGHKGRALLNSDYNQAQMLLNSLPSNGSSS